MAAALPDNFDDHIMALEGIKLMLNNGFQQSRDLFDKFKYSSPLMSAGSSFGMFLNGIMSFEDDKLNQAVDELKATQKLCTAQDDALSSLKLKLSKRSAGSKAPTPLWIILQNKIIVADCNLYLAVISFIHQEITGYIKGGWTLRKAWKIYEKTYDQIRTLHKIAQAEKHGPIDSVPCDVNSKVKAQALGIPYEILERLFGSVSFGYGLFNLCVSLIPQKLLKVVNLIGFHGDRQAGLSALINASQSQDMKAPLAMLALLWYHTVVRPFFAIDGDKPDSGIPAAEAIMAQHEAVYSKSCLVLFFKGRIQRCKRDIEGALKSFESSYDASAEQRELQLMCAYEIGWCRLMSLDWEKALMYFSMLRHESKWSTCYYTYLSALTSGLAGNKVECLELFGEVPKAMKRKTNQLEIYIVRKASMVVKTPMTYEYLLIYTLELLYLWSAFPNCSVDSLERMLIECEKATSESIQGLKNLIVGGIQRSLGKLELSLNYFRSATTISDKDYDDGHIAPYACYEMATILLENPETKAKGMELFKHSKDGYEGYDFENRLHMRIHATEHRLKEQ